MVDLWPVTGWTPDGDVDDAVGLEEWGEDRDFCDLLDADSREDPGDSCETGDLRETGESDARPRAVREQGVQEREVRAASHSRSRSRSQGRSRGRVRGPVAPEGGLAEAVAGNIRLEAARVGVSQADLARILGFSRSAVSLRYTGRVEWGISELERVAWYLNLPVTDLLQKRARPRRDLFF